MKIAITIIISIMLIISFESCGNRQATKSIINLKQAYNNAATNSEKFRQFSEIAKKEGFLMIANLFEATAKSEAIHSHNFKKSLENLGIDMGSAEILDFEVKSTNENIIESINIKALESNSTYPDYIKTSEFEKAKDATKAFKWARDSGTNFKEIFKKALIDFKNNNENAMIAKLYICPTCGNIYEDGNLTDACDLCSTSAERYILFNVK